jgi:Zn-dependent peptidase ImmA (M78 family)
MEAVTQRFVDNRDTLAGLGTDVDEIFANQFAAALLMPARRVQEFFQLKNLRADEMGILFGTSAQAIEIRLRNLRLT